MHQGPPHPSRGKLCQPGTQHGVGYLLDNTYIRCVGKGPVVLPTQVQVGAGSPPPIVRPHASYSCLHVRSGMLPVCPLLWHACLQPFQSLRP